MSLHCPVCNLPVSELPPGELVRVECDRCGTYDITDSAIAATGWAQEQADERIRRGKLGYALRRMQAGGSIPKLTTSLRDRILEETQLPSPTEQATNLLMAFGDELRDSPGARAQFSGQKIAGVAARIGALDNSDVHYAVDQLSELGLLDAEMSIGTIGGRLTFSGWQKYDDFKRQVSASRLAFMAMPFGNEKLNRAYGECFQPAVKATGFQLYRLDEQPPAGSIDNRLRVDIRRSRFLIAELSEDNSGAYWEAGFAEGLGRPVIYTCEKGQKTHFDTRQMLTIFWTEDDLDEAAQQLKDTIRATLPDEADLADPEDVGSGESGEK